MKRPASNTRSDLKVIFVFHLIDRQDASALRQQKRPEHVAYLAKIADRIAFAGPLLSDDGETPLGSLLAIEFPERSAAEEWIAAEPFSAAGVYRSSTIHPFRNLWAQRAGFPDN